MHPRRILRGIKIIFFVALACTVFGFAVRELWNALIPPIFGWHTISFWQATGLLVLSKILFGGFHGSFGGRRREHWKHRMKERMEHMTPEQRAQFRAGIRAMGCNRSPFARPAEPQA